MPIVYIRALSLQMPPYMQRPQFYYISLQFELETSFGCSSLGQLLLDSKPYKEEQILTVIASQLISAIKMCVCVVRCRHFSILLYYEFINSPKLSW